MTRQPLASLRLLATLGACALGACASLGDPPPTLPESTRVLPSAWAEPSATDAQALAPDWWVGFHSSELADLVAQALSASPDMAIAMERVQQAQLQAKIAGASLLPELSAGLGTSQRLTRPDGGPWNDSAASSAALSASYEIDLWGRNAAGLRSAQALLLASRFDQQSVRLTLLAAVASSYFQLLALRGRLAIAQENLSIADNVFKLVDARVRHGAASQLDLARQQSAVLNLRAALVSLQLQERQALYALAILLGRTPESLEVAGLSLDVLGLPRIAAGLPAQLLLRRPDLASAEAQLRAGHANVAAARAALLPSISLTASAGLASQALINVLNAPTAALALAGSLMAPIFDGGRLRAQVDAASSRERELVQIYHRAILAALNDVESALAAASRSAQQELLQEQVLAQARRALQLAQVRYREGADDLLTLLDAQRTLFAAQDQWAQVRLARLLAAVGLFKALGGGWSRAGASATAGP